jgi:threonine/homoserine/homoserine lactone efflux protein
VVLAGYVVLATHARRMFTSPRALRTVNRTAGLAMAGAAAAIVARN